ncbi:MAG: hypothetical protein LBU44_01740 [Mediterranea sp.]|jgi:hypothetical protein|nr:hypothetical protein [Mediterranea sp.]
MKTRNSITIALLVALAEACQSDVKQEQRINFEEIPPQMLRDGAVQLNAAASSGLPVTFASADGGIATVEDGKAIFHAPGRVLIYAAQPGNETYNEAPSVSRSLHIRDLDPNKQTQTITFQPPAQWQVSRDYQLLELNATASSGLPVAYTVSGASAGRFLNATLFYVYHAGEGGCDFQNTYVTTLTFTASQGGNAEYNPADNVSREIRIIGDVVH